MSAHELRLLSFNTSVSAWARSRVGFGASTELATCSTSSAEERLSLQSHETLTRKMMLDIARRVTDAGLACKSPNVGNVFRILAEINESP
jgi:hypothetical protein